MLGMGFELLGPFFVDDAPVLPVYKKGTSGRGVG